MKTLPKSQVEARGNGAPTTLALEDRVHHWQIVRKKIRRGSLNNLHAQFVRFAACCPALAPETFPGVLLRFALEIKKHGGMRLRPKSVVGHQIGGKRRGRNDLGDPHTLSTNYRVESLEQRLHVVTRKAQRPELRRV